MKSRKPGILTAAAIAFGLAIAPIASFAAAPRAAGQIGHSDSITNAQTGSTAPKKSTAKKSTPKKSTQKKSVKKTSTTKKA